MERELIDRLVAVDQKIPDRLEVPALRQYTVDDAERRMRRLVSTVGESFGKGLDRADWRRERERTFVQLPLGARGSVHHASGAMSISMGLAPMEHLYERSPDRDVLIKEIEVLAERTRLSAWVGKGESLTFERLWQIKAQGVSPEGQVSEPILCRTVGAYRHAVHDVPVWGAASAVLKVAADYAIDSILIQTRETTGETLAEAAILPPERAATSVVAQLRALMGRSRVPLEEMARPNPLRFGYFSLSKRKAQRVLAPVYVTTIDIDAADEAQGYVFVVAATEEPFLALGPHGTDGPIAVSQRSAEPVRV